MSLVEVRQEIVDKLDELDENMLMAIHTIVYNSTANQDKSILGYEADGTPISIDEFLDDAAVQLDEVRKGNYTTLEDHKKGTETWLNSMK